MKCLLKKGLRKKIGTGLFLFFFACGLFFDAKGTGLAAQNGIHLAIETVIPSLFPFFVLSGILIKLQIGIFLGPLADRTVCRLFGIDRELAAAYLLGLVGGYPIGASSICVLYQESRCSKDDALRVLSYANNCGPAFILSVVGVFLFQNPAIGFHFYLIHIAASMLIGILKRKRKPQRPSAVSNCTRPTFTAAFTASVREAMTSILNVCAFVILFSVLLHIAQAFHLFDILLPPVFRPMGTAVLSGLCEVTCGIKALQPFSGLYWLPIIVSFLLGFGGICVHCQTASLFSDAGLPMKQYLQSKLLHGLIAALLTAALLPYFSKLRSMVPTMFFPHPITVPIANPAGVLILYGSIFLFLLLCYTFFLLLDKKSL